MSETGDRRRQSRVNVGGKFMIQLHKVSPRASKKKCNQSGPYPHVSHIEYNAFEICGYTVKKHGRDLGMRDLNEIGTSMGQTMGG